MVGIKCLRQKRRFAIALILMACLSSLPSHAQSPEGDLIRLNEALVQAYQAGDYGEAVHVAEEALALARETLGPRHPDTLTSLNILALLYKAQGRYGQAEPLLEQGLELRREVLGPRHPDTLGSLNSLAGLYHAQGRYGEAEPLFEQALELSREVRGPRHPQTLTSLNNLAILYSAQGRYGEAEPLFEQALELSREVLGPQNPTIITSLNNLAGLYQAQGRYRGAGSLFERALELSREVLGPRHPNTLQTLNNLAVLHHAQGRYREAEPLLAQALELRREVLGPRHPDTLGSLNNLALLYQAQGRYGEAEPLLEQALARFREISGPRHPRTLTSLNNLAALYWAQGRYGRAEPLLEQALDLSREVLGPQHPDTLQSFNNLAALYEAQGRYGEAEPLFAEALELRRTSLGHRHPQTLSSLNNLATLYLAQGRYGEAEPLFEQALELSREVLGPRHRDTVRGLNNFAFLYLGQGRYDEAEPLLQETLELRREVLGPQHPDTLQSLNNLAFLHQAKGSYGEAGLLYEQAWSSARERLGSAHPDTLRYHLNSVVNLAAQARWPEAVGRLRQMEPHLLTWLGAELYSTEAAAVRRGLVASQAGYQHVALSLAMVAETGDFARELAATAVLRFRGLQAEEEARLAAIARRGDPEAARIATDIARLRSALGHAFRTDPASEQTTILQERLEEQELALARLNPEFGQHLQVGNASLHDVHASLPADAGLLEIRQYRQANFNDGTFGELRYAGVLLTGTELLRLIDLGAVEPTRDPVAALLSGQGGDAATQAARALHARVLAPFAAELENLDRLYIAPDGPLALVPFARLQDADGRLLAETLDVRIIQTGRDLLRAPPEDRGTGLLALGGIDFGRRATQGAPVAQDDLADSPFVPNAEALRNATAEAFRDRFAPVPGTGEQVIEIAWRYELARPDEAVEILGGRDATEQRLAAMEAPPRALHLATHGFYREPEGPLDRPMVLSGVALAGANEALAERGDDGILYAIEAQGLNLEGTELVVLSACETAQGEVDYSEGVYGLVRALRTAGARNVLVTVRPIYDSRRNNDFIVAFYENWLNQPQSDPAAALRATQLEYINDNRPPEIWSPYVLIGGY